jgi:hypothetical protein
MKFGLDTYNSEISMQKGQAASVTAFSGFAALAY